MNPKQEEVVDDRRAASALIVHEVVRRQGIEELERPAASLMWSGITAGIAIGLSLLGKAVMDTAVPDGPWTPLLQALGYSLGFVVVILGRMQLFTESTLSAVLPLATEPTGRNLLRTLRLWAIVLAANLVGTFAFAGFAMLGGLGVEQAGELVRVSGAIFHHRGLAGFLAGIPSGILLASVVWTLPSAEGQKITLIVLLTGLIDLGGFAHIVAGSAEMWVLVLHGDMGAMQALTFFVPVLFGNIVGGSILFALLAHAQVRDEIED
ncbi:transporter (formate/nitrite transporter family protein) [Sphingomonas sp. Leaf24]|nr:transporter (formate/nitrite transporter family protein) [Sphingomonas sp. Leaf5]KQM77838.1 transporter (formate/nitrite transporter family protein) [Sphingomonas sp. Leaf22]KQM96251.1 transporter (formate/nitrite transporter family protein) [Sphingomonas sp. Leaf24]